MCETRKMGLECGSKNEKCALGSRPGPKWKRRDLWTGNGVLYFGDRPSGIPNTCIYSCLN